MNHMRAHYRIILVCPFCSMRGSHSYSSMRKHMKKCKEMYRISLRAVMQKLVCTSLASARVTHTYQRRAWLHPQTSPINLEGRVNTKTIKQLISEFHTRAEKEVTAVHKACLLCKRQNAQAPDNDPKKSLCDAETDAEETPKKKQIKSTPSTTKLSAGLPKVLVLMRSRALTMMN